jgi:hypothetical protein
MEEDFAASKKIEYGRRFAASEKILVSQGCNLAHLDSGVLCVCDFHI